MNQYGIDINTLDKFITKPGEKDSLNFAGCSMKKILLAEHAEKVIVVSGEEATVYVEEGEIIFQDKKLSAQNLITVGSGEYELKGSGVVYVFSGLEKKDMERLGTVEVPFDVREKYWGDIRSMVNRAYAGKRMFVKKGQSSSLEFHCNKLEGYYIHSGSLLVRLRAGRGEDRFFRLDAGSTIFIPPGLMHQRGGIEDVVIIELSTHDEDSDSYLVEDGVKVPMPTLEEYA